MEVRKFFSQVTRMHFFPQNKLTTFCLVVALKTQAANTIFHCKNKTNKVVRYGNIFFCSHNRQGGATAVDLRTLV